MLPANRPAPFKGTPPVAGTGLFDREGREYRAAGYYGDDAKRKAGKPFAIVQYPCWRCGGGCGSDKWAHTGWTCFDCGGSGAGKSHPTPLYTQEELAVLNERRDRARDKRTAQRQIKEAEELALRLHKEGERASLLASLPFYQDFTALMSTFTQDRPAPSFLVDMFARIKSEDLTVNQEAAVRKFIASRAEREDRKVNSRFIGTPGERIEGVVKVVLCKEIYPSQANRVDPLKPLYLIKLETLDHQMLTWFTSRHYSVGVTMEGRATVKGHKEFNGVKETQVTNFRSRGEIDGAQKELF